jgi:hypothetical protein
MGCAPLIPKERAAAQATHLLAAPIMQTRSKLSLLVHCAAPTRTHCLPAHRPRRLEGAAEEAAIAPHPGAVYEDAALPAAVQLAAVHLQGGRMWVWRVGRAQAVRHWPGPRQLLFAQ